MTHQWFCTANDGRPECCCDEPIQLRAMAEVYGRDVCDVCGTICRTDGACQRCRDAEQRDDEGPGEEYDPAEIEWLDGDPIDDAAEE